VHIPDRGTDPKNLTPEIRAAPSDLCTERYANSAGCEIEAGKLRMISECAYSQIDPLQFDALGREARFADASESS